MKRWQKVALLLIPAVVAAGAIARYYGLFARRSRPSFVASKGSSIYHLSNCQNVRGIKPENLIHAAVANGSSFAGYRPCQICRPDLVKMKPRALRDLLQRARRRAQAPA